MFGHDDHHPQDQANDNGDNMQHVEPTPDGALVHDDGQATGAPVAPTDAGATTPTDTDAGNFMTDDNTPGAPAPAPSGDADTPDTASVTPTSTDADAPAAVTVPSTTAPTPVSDPKDLLDIKQQALQQLTPLVGHLEQTPEEKFRTTMMMIQAADNDALIKQAYEAAQAITDEKARAQALLDIVNEINYFTQAANTDDK
jgi:hypothetical protein